MELYNKRFSEEGICKLFGRDKLNKQKAFELLSPQKEDKVLEIGCNDGEFVNFLRTYSRDVTGCDLNEDAIKGSRIDGLDLMRAEKLGYKDNSFNKIVSLHTIEHIPELEGALNEMERVLIKGGSCILVYPFEVFRGSNNFFHAWKLHGNPIYARKLHVNKLNPRKIDNLTNMKVVKKGLFLAPYPTYFTVLVKN